MTSPREPSSFSGKAGKRLAWKGKAMWQKPKTNDLPAIVDLRGLTADEIAENWVMLPGYGRKEILIRAGICDNDHLDRCMHEHLANLPGLVTDEELQKVVDILARHGEISGLHYARRFNTVLRAPKEIIDNAPEE